MTSNLWEMTGKHCKSDLSYFNQREEKLFWNEENPLWLLALWRNEMKYLCRKKPENEAENISYQNVCIQIRLSIIWSWKLNNVRKSKWKPIFWETQWTMKKWRESNENEEKRSASETLRREEEKQAINEKLYVSSEESYNPVNLIIEA